jgi:hypothetical protein
MIATGNTLVEGSSVNDTQDGPTYTNSSDYFLDMSDLPCALCIR